MQNFERILKIKIGILERYKKAEENYCKWRTDIHDLEYLQLQSEIAKLEADVSELKNVLSLLAASKDKKAM